MVGNRLNDAIMEIKRICFSWKDQWNGQDQDSERGQAIGKDKRNKRNKIGGETTIGGGESIMMGKDGGLMKMIRVEENMGWKTGTDRGERGSNRNLIGID